MALPTMASFSTGLSRLAHGHAPDDADRAAPAVTLLEGPALDAVVKIVELQARQVPLDAFTADALPAMLAIFDAPAGALLLYRREDATLALAAARGLAVTGAEALDVLRWGDEHGSEMPLRALVDRKVYVVERPMEDAFTRRLLGDEARRPPSSVAAVPLYRWQLPVGVLLVLGGEAPLDPEALLAPAFTYAVLGLALAQLLWAREERSATPLPASDVAPPPLLCVPWVDDRRAADREDRREPGPVPALGDGRAMLEASVAAAREASRTALAPVLEELRSAIAALSVELATGERDRGALAARLEALEGLLRHGSHAAPASAPPSPIETVAAPSPPAAANAAPPPPASAAASGAPASPPTSNDASSAGRPPPAAERRVLEPDATLRAHIQTALATAIPAGRGDVAVVNLLGCDAERVAALADGLSAGIPLVGYAAEPARGSRILGPIRCFVAPPTAAEITAAVEGGTRGNRRTILLSDDIDAFLAAKTALTRAGHSVSMACDEKQALDLLAILRPDTVLVDVRNAGASAVEFLDALGPESGRVLTLLVHGDPSGATLARLAERMLRSPTLDVTELVKVCRNALPDTKRPAGGAAGRPAR